MSSPPNLDLFGNATSSLESAGGPTPSPSPGGRKTGKSGPAHVHVSRFRSLDSKEAMPTNDTSGPLFNVSSPSAALQRCLESRLRERLGSSGSPEFALTWRPVDMPAGVSLSRLAPSARRTGGSGCSGWPTPRANENVQTDLDKIAETGSSWLGQGRGATVATMAQLASWPTPVKQDAANTRNATAGRTNPESAHHVGETLLDTVTLASWLTPQAADHWNPSTDESAAREWSKTNLRGLAASWPTPKASDPDGGRTTKTVGGGNAHLPIAIREASAWATPAARDYRFPNAKTYAERGGGMKGEQLNNQAAHSGTAPSGSPEPTARRGGLNPEFVCWLMGFPTAWDACGVTATPLSRKSRRRS